MEDLDNLNPFHDPKRFGKFANVILLTIVSSFNEKLV